MNKVILIGRLASKPYKGITSSNIEYSRFTIVVTRPFGPANSDPISDFIPCIAWRTNATFINKYMDKGSLISVEGSFQSSRLTDQNGQPINNYVVSADRIQSLETREVTENRRKNNTSKEFNISEEEKHFSPAKEQENQDDEIDQVYDSLTWDNE
ncbi:single-stranded DNA-binding protein [Metamycoplasma phocicerebrale]|uniref:Single-stranded DNA-binding protein n=1 Tax=Metamycoplasma phocicerebrale TaxID=142649 RepID=A0A3T0TT61_9BACT|nr:single-stranded DNA-binding protein [Metamycoplasma phocicerebrale]AZZ65275.1 single-stranded DNA-binding protein [Metamycoplasma phocicerebrale]